MAIIKTIENPNRTGAVATYWHIGEFRFHNKAQNYEIFMHGYKDKQFREEDYLNQPAYIVSFALQGDAFHKDMTLVEVYDYIKTLDMFSGAVDDI
jgi:hypothetical protein